MNKKLLIVIIVVVVLVAGFLVWYLLRPQDDVKPISVEDIAAKQTIEDLLVGKEGSSWKYEVDSGRLLLILVEEGNVAEIEDSYSDLTSSRIKGTWKFIKDSGKEHLVIDGEYTFGENQGQKVKVIYGCIEVVKEEKIFAKEFSAVLSTGDANAQPACDGQRITYTPWTSN